MQALSAAEQSLSSAASTSVARGLPQLTREESRSSEDALRLRLRPPMRSACCRSAASSSARAPEPYVIAAAYDQVELQSQRQAAIMASPPLARRCWASSTHWRVASASCARATPSRASSLAGADPASTVAILTTRRHHLSMLFESIHFFRIGRPAAISSSARSGIRASRRRATPARHGQFGLLPLLWGTLLHLARRAARRRAGRPVLGDLHVRIRQPRLCARRQAAAGNPRRHPDHRLRLLRADHVRAVPARCRRHDRPARSPRPARWPPAWSWAS